MGEAREYGRLILDVRVDGGSSCPKQGIKYLPKNLSTTPTPVSGSS